ncbi:MAG TPA: YIP1 family protein, partial [Nitrospirota bacterium]|nr:YIP1 family protein [Nitrospirota bacterium]
TATPWEARRDIGFFNGLVKTIKETLFSPSGFFKKMPVSGGLADPLLYALIVSMAGLIVFYFWDSLLRAPLQDYVGPQFRTATEQNVLFSKGGPVLAIGTPFLLVGGLFVVSGIQHVLLLMFRGAQAGFEATFRVVCYSISPTVFLMVPVCGMPVASIWSLVLAIIGLKEAHRISGSRAALAVLAPFFACCGMLLMMIVLFLGAFAAAVGNFIQQYR